MTGTDDWTLLKSYARDRDQAAFAKIVAKYADFTFHTALRRTHNHQLAEDVAQAVFIALARSASNMRPNGSLAAWLHKTALFASTTALRGESRRRKRELAIGGAKISHEQRHADASDQSTAVIEGELHLLTKSDRDLLSLHYLEGRTMSQTADALGVSLEAARKRQTRALNRLRARLKLRGIAMSSAGVVGAIGTFSALASQNAPAQMASAVIAGGESGAAFALATQITRSIRFAFLQKAAAAIVALCLVPSAACILIAQQSGATEPTSHAPAAPISLALALPAPATGPTTLPGPSIALPDEIRKALVRNTEQIGPITLACTMQSTSTYSKEQAMEKLKLTDYYASFNAGARHEYRMEWQAGRYRSHFHSGKWPGMPEDHAPEQTLEGACDGETMYLGDVRHRPDDPNISPQGSILFRIPLTATPSKEYTADNRGWTHGEYYFTQNALRLPLSIGDLKVSRGPQSQILYLLENGAVLNRVDQVELDGREFVRLQVIKADPDREEAMKRDIDGMFDRLRRVSVNTDEELHAMVEAARQERDLPEHRQYIFYLDPEFNYALRRSEERYAGDGDGFLLKRVDCTDFQHLPGRDLFLPKKCAESEYTSTFMPGKYFAEPTVARTYTVTELKLDGIPEDRFKLSYTDPGCEIIDILDDDDGQLKGPAEGRSPRRHVVIQEDGTARER